MLCSLVGLAGCFGPGRTDFVHPDLDIASIQRVGVVPFKNYSQTSLAGERMTSMFTTELAAIDLFSVTDPGVLENYIKAMGLKSYALSKEQLKGIHKKYKLDALCFGSVDEYGLMSIGGEQLPVVTISARLVDTQTGGILWMSSATVSGKSKTPLIDIGEIHVLQKVAKIACRKTLRSLR